jgi:hypothetical protein
MEAASGVEPEKTALQTVALPLGYAASQGFASSGTSLSCKNYAKWSLEILNTYAYGPQHSYNILK